MSQPSNNDSNASHTAQFTSSEESRTAGASSDNNTPLSTTVSQHRPAEVSQAPPTQATPTDRPYQQQMVQDMPLRASQPNRFGGQMTTGDVLAATGGLPANFSSSTSLFGQQFSPLVQPRAPFVPQQTDFRLPAPYVAQFAPVHHNPAVPPPLMYGPPAAARARANRQPPFHHPQTGQFISREEASRLAFQQNLSPNINGPRGPLQFNNSQNTTVWMVPSDEELQRIQELHSLSSNSPGTPLESMGWLANAEATLAQADGEKARQEAEERRLREENDQLKQQLQETQDRLKANENLPRLDEETTSHLEKETTDLKQQQVELEAKYQVSSQNHERAQTQAAQFSQELEELKTTLQHQTDTHEQVTHSHEMERRQMMQKLQELEAEKESLQKENSDLNTQRKYEQSLRESVEERCESEREQLAMDRANFLAEKQLLQSQVPPVVPVPQATTASTTSVTTAHSQVPTTTPITVVTSSSSAQGSVPSTGNFPTLSAWMYGNAAWQPTEDASLLQPYSDLASQMGALDQQVKDQVQQVTRYINSVDTKLTLQNNQLKDQLVNSNSELQGQLKETKDQLAANNTQVQDQLKQNQDQLKQNQDLVNTGMDKLAGMLENLKKEPVRPLTPDGPTPPPAAANPPPAAPRPTDNQAPRPPIILSRPAPTNLAQAQQQYTRQQTQGQLYEQYSQLPEPDDPCAWISGRSAHDPSLRQQMPQPPPGSRGPSLFHMNIPATTEDQPEHDAWARHNQRRLEQVRQAMPSAESYGLYAPVIGDTSGPPPQHQYQTEEERTAHRGGDPMAARMGYLEQQLGTMTSLQKQMLDSMTAMAKRKESIGTLGAKTFRPPAFKPGMDLEHYLDISYAYCYGWGSPTQQDILGYLMMAFVQNCPHFIRRIMDFPAADLPYFLQKVHERYDNKSNATTQWHILNNLKQGDRPVNDYRDEFESALLRHNPNQDINNCYFLMQFTQGLRPSLRKEVQRQTAAKQPDTLNELAFLANTFQDFEISDRVSQPGYQQPRNVVGLSTNTYQPSTSPFYQAPRNQQQSSGSCRINMAAVDAVYSQPSAAVASIPREEPPKWLTKVHPDKWAPDGMPYPAKGWLDPQQYPEFRAYHKKMGTDAVNREKDRQMGRDRSVELEEMKRKYEARAQARNKGLPPQKATNDFHPDYYDNLYPGDSDSVAGNDVGLEPPDSEPPRQGEPTVSLTIFKELLNKHLQPLHERMDHISQQQQDFRLKLPSMRDMAAQATSAPMAVPQLHLVSAKVTASPTLHSSPILQVAIDDAYSVSAVGDSEPLCKQPSSQVMLTQVASVKLSTAMPQHWLADDFVKLDEAIQGLPELELPSAGPKHLPATPISINRVVFAPNIAIKAMKSICVPLKYERPPPAKDEAHFFQSKWPDPHSQLYRPLDGSLELLLGGRTEACDRMMLSEPDTHVSEVGEAFLGPYYIRAIQDTIHSNGPKIVGDFGHVSLSGPTLPDGVCSGAPRPVHSAVEGVEEARTEETALKP